MDRRSALKNLTVLATGAFLFPSCLSHRSDLASIELHKLKVTADQEATLGEVTETIIPKTTSPGAKQLNVHHFVLVMMDDCRDDKQQHDFLTGLAQLNDLANKDYHKGFADCAIAQREALLTKVEAGKNLPPELVAFYNMTKQLTVEGYTISKYVMTDKLPYELVPSRYSGYFPVDKLKTKVVNV